MSPASGHDDIVVDFPRRQISLPRPPWWGLATAATLAIALLLPLAAGGGPRSDTLIRFSSSSSDAFGPSVASLPGGKIVVVWQGPASPAPETPTSSSSTTTTFLELIGSKPAQTEETTTSTTGDTTTTTAETTSSTEPTTSSTEETTTSSTETPTTTSTETPTTTSTESTTSTTESTTSSTESTTTTTEAPTTTTTTRPSLPGEGIFARIGPANGGDLDAEIKVSDWGTNPSVAADSAGNFIVAWAQDGDVYTKTFNSAGTPTRDATVLNLSTTGDQGDPAVSAVPNLTNQFAVVFAGAGVEDTEGLPGVSRSANRTDDAGIWLRYTGPTGNQPTQTLVNAASAAGPQGHPSVVATGINAVTVVWDGTGPDDADGVFGARDVHQAVIVPSGGSTTNTTVPAAVNHLSPVAGSQSDPKVALVGQTPVVAWSGAGPDDPDGIWAVPFDGTDRTPVLVNGFTDGGQLHPAASGTSGSIVTVAWDGPGPDDTAGVWARRWDITANSGAPLSPQFRVNTPVGGTQSHPAVTPTASGQYTVVFDRESGSSDRAVYARPYNVNDPPVGVDDNYTVDEDTQLVVDSPDGQNGHLAGVLANDSDPDGDPLTATVATPPDHVSSFNLQPDGTFTVQAAPNYNGVVTFTYRVQDARGAQALSPTRVTITVNSVDDGPPVPQADVYPDLTAGLPGATEDTQFAITDPKQGLLANDTDPDGDPLTAELAPDGGAGHGTAVVETDGTFTYTPDHNFCGTGATQAKPADSFQYMTTGGGKTSGPTTVTMKVTCVKDPPEAHDDQYNVAEDTALEPAAPGVLKNDFLDDGVDPMVTVIERPKHGEVRMTGGPGPLTGHFVYQPAPDYNGPDSFTYKLIDASETPPTTTTTSSTTTTTSALSVVTDLVGGTTTTTTAPAPTSAADSG
ncbi:MAG TPA: cadherin-like domain-containing protein, partial [Acidimicrobiia bacterium]|nr:cadherin-like domain-containing protein [Acidimicrobiia bacterium]